MRQLQTKIRVVPLALAALLCMAQSAWAWSGSGTQDSPYLITSTSDWNTLSSNVNNGNNYSGKYFRQTANINVSSHLIGYPIDDNNFVTFNGVYDGGGYTIAASISEVDKRYVAPFCCIADATIKNVVVTGSVIVSGGANVGIDRRRHPAGLVGVTDGTCVIQNCRVSADVSGTDYMGGILGHSMNANITMTGCSYNGNLSATDSNYTGGLIGWGCDAEGLTLIVADCLFAGSYSGSGKFHPVGCLYILANNVRTVENTYYTVGLQNMTDEDEKSFVSGLSNKGKFARSITGGAEVTVNLGGSTTAYGVSGITAGTCGLKCNGVCYAGADETVTLALSHDAPAAGYAFDRYTISSGSLSDPTINSPTLTMPAGNVTIYAQWTLDTYTITYNLNGGSASNPANYNYTTATFTLNNPTRDGYLFAGWTGSNGDTPQTVVTITQGSTGNMAYTANWISWDEVNAYVGKVIGADGKMYKTVAAAQNAGTTASGVIAYWGWAGSADASSSAYRGLAISLETWTAIPWCADPCAWYADSTLTQALDSKDGCERTTAFGRPESRNVTDVYGHIHNHQAAALVYDYDKSRPSGSSRWFVPSLGQWNLVAKALTGSSSDISAIDNPDYTYSNLSAKLTAAGAAGLGWAAYWSSTEKNGTTMWIFDIGGIGGDRNGGRASTRSKQQCGEAEYLRAFFAFEDATDAVYTISYDANGGSGAPSAQTKDGGIDLTLSSTEPTREGCTFVGWATSVNGEVAYQPGDAFTGNADATLYAQWEIVLDDKTATVETAADCGQGESVAAIPVSVNIGEGISSKAGVTVRYELDQVTKSGDVVSEGATTESAGDLSIDLTSVVSNAFFKVAAVVESTDGTGSKAKVSSETTIGVLAVTNAPKTAIIGVPWKSLAGGDISVDKLVRTENLTKGDQIMVYDYSTDKYKAWALNEGKAWDEVATVTANDGPENPGAASATSVARGSGVWLTRQDPSQPIYLVGQFVDEAVETDLEMPDEPGEQVWNLVASPKVEPVDVAILLNDRQATDKVMVPSAGAPKNFIYNATLGKWGYIDYKTGEDGRVRAFFRDDDTLIQPGTGFWYLNGDTTHDSLEW